MPIKLVALQFFEKKETFLFFLCIHTAAKPANKKWNFVTKIVLTYCDREKLFLRSLEQFIQTVKGQNNFW